MTEENKECKCCECREKLVQGLKEFTFKALIVYVGVTLAIITSANVLKSKHPCHRMMPPRPGIERQMPPMGYHGDFNRGEKSFKHLKLDKKQPPIQGVEKPKFPPMNAPQPPVKPNK